ncbi:oxidoreductase [Longimycelium tulufanense]|uniref:Oxidoreductase n=1 Tax=Longimycelium tulufanense TaxID=907463 RepID=A0A8J3CCT5_9PSEU|nr:aldo/keto reductase [Longimycelium tulufanense]GGM40534.1 oxidoreductase [Longimycelium tulufanense]
MQYRQLGSGCGLRISTLTFGTLPIGGRGGFEKAGTVDVAGARRLLDIALEHGVNMIDTANMYSYGQCEEILGEILQDSSYDDLMVTTKVRMVVEDGPNGGGQSRWHVLDQVDKSLRRLRRDHIDLYYLHEWDGQTPLEESLHTMDTLVRAGKIRYYGVSNYTAWQLMKVLMTCERHNFVKPVAQQIYYTPHAREVEYELIPAALDQGIGVQVWSPLAGGLLTGKYRRGQDGPADARQAEKDWQDPVVKDRESLYDLVDLLGRIAAQKGRSIAQVALAWLLQRPAVSSVVVGARGPEQWLDCLGAVDVSLTADEIEAIDAANPPALAYPFWHQAMFASERLSDADRVIDEVMWRFHDVA